MNNSTVWSRSDGEQETGWTGRLAPRDTRTPRLRIFLCLSQSLIGQMRLSQLDITKFKPGLPGFGSKDKVCLICAASTLLLPFFFWPPWD